MSDIDHTKLRRLDMTLLLVFAELVRHRKMTLVAERLGLTQSAISHNLKRLRDIFGDELFLRRPAGVEPTGRALALEPKVAAILALSSEALNIEAEFRPAQDGRTVRIAALDYEEAMFAAPLIEHFRRVAPNMRLVFRSLSRQSALDALSEGEVDVALGYFHGPGENFEVQTLYEETYNTVVHEHHVLAKGRLTINRFCKAEHLLVSIGGDLRGVVDATLAQSGRSRNVVAAVPLFLAALATVSRTQLVCTIPSRLARRFAPHYKLAILKPPLEIRSFTVQLLWHRRSTAEPGMQWFRKELAAVVENSSLAGG